MKILILVGALLLSGCVNQYASTGEHVYQKAKNGSSIAIPSHDNAEEESHYYDLPTPEKKAKASVEPPED